MSKIEILKKENDNITMMLEKAERDNDFDAIYKLKKQYYSNKLSMLELLTVKNETFTISARELKRKTDAKPHAIRYETGISVLDEKLKGGFEVGSLIQLAGQSFAGKTTLFLSIVANIAKDRKSVV